LIILGGAGPTGAARQLIDTFPWIDYVCVGEGEQSLLDLARRIKTGAASNLQAQDPLPGFYTRCEGQPVYTPRSRLTDLDSLPLPAYHHIDFADYDAAFSIVTSRGCPYRCSFCTETSLWDHRVVFRSVESVVEEVRLLQGLCTKRVVLFQDDQLTLDRPRAVRLFEALSQANLGVQWKCFVRADQVDEGLLALMAQAGCIQVRLGVESGSNRILQAIHKGFTVEQAFQVARLALQVIPSVHASFIWGFPFETIQECRETLQWAQRFQEVGCTVLTFLLSPLPNSEIYRDYTGPLDFNPALMPNFNNLGGENLGRQGTRIIRNAQYLFDFIREYPRVFPGFFLYDDENNIRPKLALFQKEGGFLFRRVRDLAIGDYGGVDL
jgi:radical SAM superfamily enzyme YgiQ (UPF0313 family)